MRTNFVLIDYENVQPKKLSALNEDHFKVIVFVGANQTKLSFEFAEALQQMGSNGRYIQITGNGSNALDFHIAFYIGQLAKETPDSYFHIISKDTGFDPLIRHLKTQKIFATRSRDIADIPLIKVANSKSLGEKAQAIIENLQQRGASKPRKVKTLLSTINSLFLKKLSETELSELLKELESQKIIVITNTNVSYALPT